mmetsp:Transcript_9146/g.20361  ORF Transcript_9146/g.20361 Transcript_9146/m.20361 type:complete len:237 (-) Transcript_9146:767-1477(-)
MCSDEVYRVCRASAIVLEEILTSTKSGSKVALLSGITLDELPSCISEKTVPFTPSRWTPRWKTTNQVAVWPRAIPWFGNELCSGQRRIRCYSSHQRRVVGDLSISHAAHCGCQIKSEAIHMHLIHPIAQARTNPLRTKVIVRAHRVPAASVVGILTSAQKIVMRFCNLSPGVPVVLAPGSFRGVIENHIEHHLNAHSMQLADHSLESNYCTTGLISRREALHRHFESYGGVAPVVA